MNHDNLIDLRNVCEPTLSMRLKQILTNADFNSRLQFVANDSLVFRQVNILCKIQGHHWLVLENNKNHYHFQIRIGKPTLKQKTMKHKFLHAALTF